MKKVTNLLDKSLILEKMNTQPASDIENIKPSRKELKEKVKREKARVRIEKKEQLRKKTEKKLAEKAERKVSHKKANAQKKFEAKMQKKKVFKKP
jgi:hypothetical protein